MKRCRTTILAGFALAFPIVMGPPPSSAAADDDFASNGQVRGQYAGTNSGGCLVAFSGFDKNDRPVDPTTSYSTLLSADDVFTFDGRGGGSFNSKNIELRVPGPNASFVPQSTLSNGSGSFTYSVGAKGTVTVVLKNPSFKILNGPSAGLTSVIDEVVLEGHFGPNGVTLTKIDGAAETVTVSNGASFPRICERSFVLLSDRPRF